MVPTQKHKRGSEKRFIAQAPAIKALLGALSDGAVVRLNPDADPIGLVKPYDTKHGRPKDLELAGLVAALLAFGNIRAIRASVARVLAILGSSPFETVTSMGGPWLHTELREFRHRVYRGEDVATLLVNAVAIQTRYRSLGVRFGEHLAAATQADPAEQLRHALGAFSDELRHGLDGHVACSPGLKHLVPDVSKGSACKRLLLYLRWMIRRETPDFGLWDVSPSLLLLPLDVHTHRMARNLGLTLRNDASWKTSREVTARLRSFDPDDPVRYDFALCHFGVSRECKARRDLQTCEGCALKPVCVHWAKGDKSR